MEVLVPASPNNWGLCAFGVVLMGGPMTEKVRLAYQFDTAMTKKVRPSYQFDTTVTKKVRPAYQFDTTVTKKVRSFNGEVPMVPAGLVPETI